jgi:putative PIN family toxin of toxin-antitoxin system
VLREDFRWSEEQIAFTVRTVAKVAEVVSPRERVNVVVDDPDDNMILECAASGKADLVVSNDHHLLDLKVYKGIPIIAGPDFRRILGVRG